jgi:hypothetical protein
MSNRLLVRDESGERDVKLGAPVTIGRDPTCTISVDDPRLSRRHAEFVAKNGTVLVRDLGSRNGIEVNGVRTSSAMLHAGDVVVVAGLTLTLAPNDEQGAAPALIDDKTILALQQPGRLAAARAGLDVIDDGTRLVSPSMAAPATSAPSIAPMHEGVAASRTASTAARSGVSFSGHLFATLALLAGVLLLVTIGTTWWLEARLTGAAADAQAAALSNWFASEVRSVGTAQAALDRVTDRVGREAGVVSALVLAPDGRVLAPSARLSESVPRIPALNVAPRALAARQQADDQGALQIAQPVAGSGSSVVWLTVDPAASASGGALTIGLIALTTLFGTLLAANVIRQRVTHGLARFKEDVELALNGQVAGVHDTLGSAPLEELSTVLNYLILRVRSGAGASGDASRDHGGSQSAGRAAGTSGQATEAWMIADANLRIIEASPSCTELFGVRADAFLGRHLLDAFPDRQIGDAVLKCLSTVSISGRDQTLVSTPGESEAGNLFVSVSRETRTDPITVRFALKGKALV